MDFINDNAPIITVVLFVITAVILIVLLIINQKIYKSFGSKRFAFNDLKENGIDNAQKWFSVIALNKSLNDATITAIGICYQGQYFDCRRIFKEQNNISEDGKIVIMQRTFIKLQLAIDDIEKAVFSTVTKRRIMGVKAYLIDGFGNMFKAKAKTITKTLNSSYKKLLDQKAKQQKEQRTEQKRLKRQEFIERINVKKINNEKLKLNEILQLFIYQKLLK
ncbi:MAG: hypothetical protein PHE12_04275 [Clostridia bacterium]|nr:hypothetical protein [Clostridia bacterium]